MNASYVEVTFRRGKPLAAYVHLPREGRGKSTRTVDVGKGMLVDYDARGAPIGIEVTGPDIVGVRDINAILRSLGQPTMSAKEWPLKKAA